MNFEAISQIQGRINQIQSLVSGKVQSMDNTLSANKPLNFNEIIKAKMNLAATGGPKNITETLAGDGSVVKPLTQSNSVSCGQASVAMAINSVTGKNLTDIDINSNYGFDLLPALNSECRDKNIAWSDGGTISVDKWSLIEQKVNSEGLPVIVGLNGPEFSPSGRGHIVTITKIEGDVVTYADPATGTMKTTTKQNMNNAPTHPDGNFIFYAKRDIQPDPMAMMNLTPEAIAAKFMK